MGEQATAQVTNAAVLSPPVGSGILQRKCACGQHTMGGDCKSCKKGAVAGNTLQRAATTSDLIDEVPPIVHEVLRSPGQPLDSATRSFFEPRFGHDFSNVRVHTDPQAAESALAVNALAYTVGRDVVFAGRRYMPGTNPGRALLAHELTHVIQQGSGVLASAPPKSNIVSPGDASELEADAVARHITEGTPLQAGHLDRKWQRGSTAGMLQRSPAPPSYGGVTGVRDLDKLTIDPVPDLDMSKFLVTGLLRPLVVYAHLIDPAIAHLTWMLHDPKDQMIAGFSTLPKQPTSKTMPFTLKPSHFSGAEGKYILRCSGLNEKHQPIVYADRDITVVKADLKTGTDLATTYGKLTFTKYEKTDANPPATPNWKVEIVIRFLADRKVVCDDVTYIQALESVDDSGKSQQKFTSAEQEARQTPLTWSVDRVAGAPSPFYIMGRDKGKVVDVKEDPKTGLGGWGTAGKGGPKPTKATLLDTPQWNKPTHDKFETCVICRSGTNNGQCYGCTTWGYTADASGKVTLQPRSFRQTPSDQFTEARDAWNKWRTKVPKATRPDEFPALAKP